MEPHLRIGLAALSEFAFDGGDLKAFYAKLIPLVQENPTNAGVMMDLSVLAQMQGHQDLGLAWQGEAFKISRVYRSIRQTPAKKTVLVFAAPIHMGGNTPVDLLLRSDEFDVVTYYPSFDMSPEEVPQLPEHDIAFCAAPADHAQAQAFYAKIRHLAALQDLKVVNLPDNLVKPERELLPKLFANVPGLHVPKTQQMSRDALQQMLALGNEADVLAETGSYPFIIRPAGSHAGFGLEKIDSREDFASYLATRAEDEFSIGEFINYASPEDGMFRKARVVLVDGKAYPSHYAIADHWDIWYANSKMEESPWKRLEEEAFMDNFRTEFCKRHQNAFEAMNDAIGLEYVGFDCAEDADGNLVVFEIDNALIVHNLDSSEIYPYKQRHMRQIFKAVERMLSARCQSADTAQFPDLSRLVWPPESELLAMV
ncbi:hypothetical protein GFB49_13295 [Epibacterium sp. SM1979]|uniref:ATP-grasp domain-containing protein n=1 Tax=Tritonibacter litoralis TaxID=2662264 RepID=A0A843YL76_9RHOB|nr:hypothetical protein [Tritonibacter litoralis]MQQ09437.1 hypothetical protein [Tritonibacter litoralis]